MEGQLQFMVYHDPASLEEAKKTMASEARQIRLTKDSLDCFKKDSQVEVEHSYSLSNMEKIGYNESDPTSFHIVFPTFTTVLQAETGKEAKDWVEKIKSALGREQGTMTDNQQKAMLLANTKDSDKEAEQQRDKIEMQAYQSEAVENREELEQESMGREDKQQLLTDTNSNGKDSAIIQGAQNKQLPFLKELKFSRERSPSGDVSTSFANPLVTAELPSSSANTATRDTPGKHDNMEGAIKTGLLSKTTIGRREGSRPGPTRHRNFRLTEVDLEYLHQFSHVKVKRSFPLTSIEEVEYDEENEPTTFRLIFSNCIEVLQAETPDEASDWVEKIVEACKKWDPAMLAEESFDESAGLENDESADQLKSSDQQSRVEFDSAAGESEPSAPPKRQSSVSRYRQRSLTTPVSMVGRYHHHQDRYDHEDHREAFITRWKARLGSKRAKQALFEITTSGLDSTAESAGSDFRVNYRMIMYPRHMLGLPNEKLFKMDTQNMQIMWRRTHRHSRFHYSRSLSLHKVVEVREGQKSTMFDKFPYEQVDKQSFSLIYQQEDKRYAYLTSLDLICDQPESYNLWIKELKSMVKSQSSSCTHPRLSNQDCDTTDTTILWLKQLWSCKSDKGELSERDAIRLARKLDPSISEQYAKRIVAYSHQHQVGSSHGLSLEFNGFVLMYNLLEATAESRLYSIIFKKYAESPHLGMTPSEFRKFLVNECYWQEKSCTNAALRKLIQCHDSYHYAYKKYSSKNKSADFVASCKRLSYAGFISFLRSKDNPVIDPEHETVYQDMTQPLSHYFINSSHNTYLEGHQLNGKSSTEAYTRVLLQGCRCIEIDCWDDTLNVVKLPEREPIIYHGFTLTTKLPFRDVIHAIRDYAFHSSPYPVVISIENHCNKAHQAKMAKIFRAIFDEMLPKEDLVEQEGRERLPSPEELREKIILKSPVKEEDPNSKGTVRRNVSKPVLPHSSSTLSVPPPRTDETSPGIQQKTEQVDGATTEEYDGARFNRGPLRLSFRTRRRQLGEIQKKVEELEQGKDDQEVEFIETVEDLSSLIIYAKCKYIKPWDWEVQRKTEVTQLLSFGEPTAVKLCIESSREMLAATERQLVRTYPKGIRFDSSNYDPFTMWAHGIQMATLNFQTLDIYMHLNQGFFRLNGGCGYVLKPAVMRREDPGGGSTPFDPEMQTPHPDVPPIDLEIELISGQRLSPWKKKRSSVSVVVHTYGVTHDCGQMKEATHDKVLWPSWEEGKHNLQKTIFMPELCLVYFRVEADKKLFGQNCIPVISLQPGIKFIPLRTPGGELIPGSGLFVKIKKTAAAITTGAQTEQPEASDRKAAEDALLTSQGRRISRQEAIDIERGTIRDTTKVAMKYGAKRKEAWNDNADESDEREGKFDSEDPTASYKRRFTSPAVLESSPADNPFKEYDSSSKLIIVAEVHEN